MANKITEEETSLGTGTVAHELISRSTWPA
jgi:hypothetical protein